MFSYGFNAGFPKITRVWYYCQSDQLCSPPASFIAGLIRNTSQCFWQFLCFKVLFIPVIELFIRCVLIRAVSAGWSLIIPAT
ncbi:hypothetical protein CS542_09765 [Pedobacter sp. IW39]|nr:hypothetical protein CS542_09765 [Pedobacter sp. IW39]